MPEHRYAIICAPHSGNAGMVSVDRGAEQFFEKHNANFTLFTAQKKRGNHMNKYRFLESWEDLRHFTHVVYWGDFLNNPVYGYVSFPSRSKRWGYQVSRPQAIKQWKQLFLPGLSASQQIFSVGGNFQHDFTQRADKYPSALTRLEGGVQFVYPRDSFSVQNLSRHFTFDGMQKVKPGTDCAFLQSENFNLSDSGTFVYFFNRSKLESPEKVVEAIERKSGLKGVELTSWLSLGKNDWDRKFSRLKEQIETSELVVTDTYHVCVNALHSRKPLLGIGRETSKQSGTLGDFKKKILFDMFGIEDLYVAIGEKEGEETVRARIVDRLDSLLETQRVASLPYDLIDAKVSEFRARLTRDLGLDITNQNRVIHP